MDGWNWILDMVFWPLPYSIFDGAYPSETLQTFFTGQLVLMCAQSEDSDTHIVDPYRYPGIGIGLSAYTSSQ